MAIRTLQFVGTIWQEGNMYTAYCPELDLATCGHTVEEARRNLHETIEISFQEAADSGPTDTVHAGGCTPPPSAAPGT